MEADGCYDSLKHYHCRRIGLPFHWLWVKAQVAVESGFKPKAASPVSAKGRLQLMPAIDIEADGDLDALEIEGNLGKGIWCLKDQYDLLSEIPHKFTRIRYTPRASCECCERQTSAAGLYSCAMMIPTPYRPVAPAAAGFGAESFLNREIYAPRQGVPLKMRNFVGILFNFSPVLAPHRMGRPKIGPNMAPKCVNRKPWRGAPAGLKRRQQALDIHQVDRRPSTVLRHIAAGGEADSVAVRREGGEGVEGVVVG